MSSLLDRDYDADIILIGEVHQQIPHQVAEERIVYETEPEAIYLESLGTSPLGELSEDIEQAGAYLSLGNIEELFEEGSFLEGNYEDLLDEVSDMEPSEQETQEYIFPETVEELRDTNVSHLYPDIIGAIIPFIEEKALQDTEDQRVIAATDNLMQVYTMAANPFKPTGNIFAVARPVYDLRQQGYEIQVGGADIDKQKRFDELEKSGMEALAALQEEEISEEREEEMAERLIEGRSQRETDRPVVGIFGRNHLDGIEKNLKGSLNSGIIERIDPRSSQNFHTIDLGEEIPVKEDGGIVHAMRLINSLENS